MYNKRKKQKWDYDPEKELKLNQIYFDYCLYGIIKIGKKVFFDNIYIDDDDIDNLITYYNFCYDFQHQLMRAYNNTILEEINLLLIYRAKTFNNKNEKYYLDNLIPIRDKFLNEYQHLFSNIDTLFEMKKKEYYKLYLNKK
jgi:hypothetical protein